MKFRCLILISAILFSLASRAEWKAEGSGNLIELYTSEGCSSCPPADKWLSGLKEKPELWKKIVPISFHVKYWDQLGWPDRFAKDEYTKRQREHAGRWGTGRIYTPEIVIQGKESSTNSSIAEVSGVLRTNWNGSILRVDAPGFEGGRIFVAWLAMDQVTDVRRGENSGKKLTHDFIVTKLQDLGEYTKEKKFELTRLGNKETAQALAVWIEKNGIPVIAVGGSLP